MTVKAAFRQTDIDRILKAAAKVGSTVQIDMSSRVITIQPEKPALTMDDPDPGEFESLAEWTAWRERQPDRVQSGAKGLKAGRKKPAKL